MKVFCSLLLLIMGSLSAQDFKPVGHGHVHEAFMTHEAPVTLLQSVDQRPPELLKEEVPPQQDPAHVWVHGYWEWSREHQEFVWCSGGWRLPPPDHMWIAGYWMKRSGSWVRVKGFWSKEAPAQFEYFSKAPPEPRDENPKNPPGDDYFWLSGYWKNERGHYVWYNGMWEKTDADWVYTPARYIWREQGYVFVAPYWDYPLEERGEAYGCVHVPSGATHIDYTPDMVVTPEEIVQGCLLTYPNYIYFYYHHYHFHHDWWVGCDFCPPWWGWDWWWFSWADQWAIWWWWVNPGFFAPPWLDQGMIALFFGPPEELTQEMQHVAPPPIVTPDGVVTPSDLIDALGDNTPILPEDATDIQGDASQGIREETKARPKGDRDDIHEFEEKAEPMPQTGRRPPRQSVEGAQPVLPHTAGSHMVAPPSKPRQRVRPEPPTTESRPRQRYRPEPPQTYTPRSRRTTPRYEPPARQEAPSYRPPSSEQYHPYMPPQRRAPTPRYIPPTQSTPRYTPPSESTPRYTPPTQTKPRYTPPPRSMTPSTNYKPQAPRYTPELQRTTPRSSTGSSGSQPKGGRNVFQ